MAVMAVNNSDAAAVAADRVGNVAGSDHDSGDNSVADGIEMLLEVICW